MKKLSIVVFFAVVVQAESEYLFEQQYNDGCRVLPLINLYKLERLSKKYGAQNIVAQAPWYEWHSRREALGVFFPFYYEWANAFNILNTNPGKYPHLHAYLRGMALNGPVLPHFYDASGSVPTIKYTDENNNQQFAPLYTIASLPFMLIDYGSIMHPDTQLISEYAPFKYEKLEYLQNILPQVKTLLPLGKNKANKDKVGDYVLYNSVTHMYDVINVHDLSLSKLITSCGYEYPFDITKDVDVPQGSDLFVWQYKKYAKLNELGPVFIGTLSMDEGGECKPEYPLGFEEIGYLKKLPLEIKVATGKAYGSGLDAFDNSTGLTSYAPADLGRIKLMFLRLGIDENNQDITEKHPLYGAYQDFKKLCNSSPQHPWNDTYCKKDAFLQYEIARILKQNTQLCSDLEAMMAVLNLHSAEAYEVPLLEKTMWEQYKSFMSVVEVGLIYRDRNGTAYTLKSIAPYMLGKEQGLAVLVMSIIRTLFYGAIETSIFTERTGIDSFADYVKALESKKIEGKNNTKISFIDIWHKIKENLQSKNYFSLELHGWVVSFDQSIVALQVKKLSSQGKKVLQLIGCTGIESIYASEFKDAFYKRDRKTLQILRDEYARIAMVEELSRQLIAVGTFKISDITGLSVLKKINEEGKQLSKDQLKELESMEEKLKLLKQEAEKVQSETAKKIQKAYRAKK